MKIANLEDKAMMVACAAVGAPIPDNWREVRAAEVDALCINDAVRAVPLAVLPERSEHMGPHTEEAVVGAHAELEAAVEESERKRQREDAKHEADEVDEADEAATLLSDESKAKAKKPRK